MNTKAQKAAATRQSRVVKVIYYTIHSCAEGVTYDILRSAVPVPFIECVCASKSGAKMIEGINGWTNG